MGRRCFRAKVEEYLGHALESLRPMPPLVMEDHLGWHEQVDGNWFLGVYVENGRVHDEGTSGCAVGCGQLSSASRPR